MPKFSFRLPKSVKAERERERQFYKQQYEENLRRQQELENEIRKRERELYLKNEDEERLKEQEQKQRQAELHKIQQLEIRKQEEEARGMEQLRNTTPEALRRLRGLIRSRYEQDMYIWSCRGVQRSDQEIVIREGVKADAILKEIYDIVDTWEENGWTQEEWKVAKRIKELLSTSEQRIWANNPPWNDRDA